jgi:CheY-like chemotaxis protein
MVMPEMGGAELARRVRARYPQIRLLFMSGYTEDAALQQGFLDYSATFIEKPFVPSAFAQRIRDMLDLPRPATGASTTT